MSSKVGPSSTNENRPPELLFQNKQVTIVGAGLCGTLAAILFEKEGYTVSIYDKRREDEMFADSGRSFNITLTERGLIALRECGLEDMVLEAGVRCFGRQVYEAKLDHEEEPRDEERKNSDNLFFTPYGQSDNAFLLSISRKALNKILFREMKNQNISVNLGHKCVKAYKLGDEIHIKFQTAGETTEVVSNFVIGADGAWSFMRKAMMHHRNWDFSQHFSKMKYKELYIPATEHQEQIPIVKQLGDEKLPTTEDSKEAPEQDQAQEIGFSPSPTSALASTTLATTERCYALATSAASGEQALQLWPRDNFLLLAMPNKDHSFSATLFAQDEVLSSLTTKAEVRRFFDRHFPEASAVMPTLGADWFDAFGQGNIVGTLLETRCSPFHVAKEFVLVGDAAHAMLPFMGQGTNCAFEDVLVLVELLKETGFDPKIALPAYTAARKPHVDALATMAKEHDRTLSTMSKDGKPLACSVREALATWFPGVAAFRSAYENVAFTTTPYATAIEDARQTEGWLERALTLGAVSATALSCLAVGIWIGYQHAV